MPKTFDFARRRRDDGLPLQRVENHQDLRRRIGALSGYSPAMERVADPPIHLCPPGDPPGRTPFCKLNTNPGGPSATNKYQGNQRR